jgi:hypothetical protein
MKPEYSRQIFEKFQISNFMEIRPVGAELSHEDRRTDRPTDRQTDRTKQIVAFGIFANAPKNLYSLQKY